MAWEEAELGAAPGAVDPDVAAEFPGLRLDWLSVEARDGPSPPGLVQRLRALSDRINGAAVVAMRTKPIPQAYRSFFRQIGLDPDVDRIPSEAAAVRRLFEGGFRPHGLVRDATDIALIETGVPVWALDADRVDVAGPGIRMAAPGGERLGRADTSGWAQEGTLVVVDAATVHAVIFGPVAADSAVTAATLRIVLFAVAVAGVPRMHIEEALWLAVEAVRTGAG